MKYKDKFLVRRAHKVTRRELKLPAEYAALIFCAFQRLTDEEITDQTDIKKKTISNTFPKIHDRIGRVPGAGKTKCDRKGVVEWARDTNFIVIRGGIARFNWTYLIEECGPKSFDPASPCAKCKIRFACDR